jgi:tetratricopeptide (TPR) repeat protein
MHNLASDNTAQAVVLRDKLQALEARYRSTSPARTTSSLDSATIEKLRSLGYVAYKAPSEASASKLSLPDPKDKIQTLNQMLHAGDLRSQGRFADSDEILKGLEKSEPSLYIVGFERAETLLDWGKARDSIAEFRKALALNSTFDEAWAGLGRAEFTLGENKDAADALALALRFNPRNYLARRLLARVYLRQEKPEQAERELAQVVSEHPNFAEARAEHGLALAKVKKYREAIAEFQAGSKGGYRDAVAYYYWGFSYSETGDTRNAIIAYQEAVEMDPNYAAAYARLALLYRQQGELSKAKEYYGKTCRLSEELCQEFRAQFQ